MKNSFHIKDMNAVSPLYELSGGFVRAEAHKNVLPALMTCIQFLSSVDVHVHLRVSDFVKHFPH